MARFRVPAMLKLYKAAQAHQLLVIIGRVYGENC